MSTYTYSVAYTPPMPVCTLHLGAGGEEAVMGPLEAIIDTGADITIVPQRYLQQLGVRPISQGTARSVWGDRRVVFVYAVSLRLERLHIRALQVLADPESDEIVLGRNVLNRLHLVLDGPANVIEIVENRTI